METETLDMNRMENVTIPEFYANKNVFITGATGFIGKVFMEKMLRCCPDVKGLYCLVRPKKGLSGEDRLHQLFKDKLYDKLRNEHPDFEQKVHAIHGDCLDEKLGIKESDVELLNSKINIVFHSAATVRFDEHLRLALNMNVLGVRKMIALAKGLKHLEVFVHVSTAYANCDRKYIEELVYPSPLEPQRLIDAFEWMDDEMITSITPKLIGEKPNTYTYTKQLAETLIIHEGADLPLAIVRPSIVTAAWREPIPGWIDNFNGPSGLYIAAGKGILRSFRAEPTSVADFVPVDLPVNMMLAVAWYTVVKKPAQNAQVYHITSGGINPLRWGEIEDVVLPIVYKIPFESCFRRPKCHLTRHDWLNRYWTVVSHNVPAYLADLGFILMGKKPRMVSIYNKLHKNMNILEYFTVRSWEWTHSHMDVLKHSMSPEDLETFYIDPKGLHWQSYIENYVLGTKKYIMKEDMSGLPAARAHLKKLRNIRYTFNTIVMIVLWRFLVARSNIARNSWQFFMGLLSKFVQIFKLTSTISAK